MDTATRRIVHAAGPWTVGSNYSVLVAACLAIAGCVALLVDVPLSRWVIRIGDLGPVEQLSRLAEVFGHGLGVVLIVLSIWVLDPVRRAAVPRLLAASLGSGLVANGLKLLLARSRPVHFDLAGGVLDTFSGWLPMLSAGSPQQSFPSAHTATAMGFAVALSVLYPRGRYLFPFFATLVAMQRLLGGAHFLSDTLWGAAAGCLFGSLCLGNGWLARRLDRLDRWTSARLGALRSRRAASRVGTMSVRCADDTSDKTRAA